jgi:hypothetical protein
LEPGRVGCRDVHYRSVSPGGSWSTSTVAVDPAENVSMPRVAATGTELHLFWLQGTGNAQGEVKTLWHCVLRDGKCQTPKLLSPNNKLAAFYDVGSSPTHMFIAWSQEDTQSGIIYGRWWKSTGWGNTLTLSNSSQLARYPSVTVDSSNQAHVVWQAGLDGIQQVGGLAGRAVEYAAISQQGTVQGPSRLETGHLGDRVRPRISIKPSGMIGVIYNADRDIFLVERMPGASWSKALNITRIERGLSSPMLNSDGGNWVATWTTGALGTFHLWQVQEQAGQWLRPQLLIYDAPYDELVVNLDVLIAGKETHMIWTGAPNGIASIENLYAKWLQDYRPTPPPTISNVFPASQSWVRGPTWQLSAQVGSSAPLDQGSTRWHLDGVALPTTVGALGKILATANASDGPHTAQLVVADQAGNTKFHNISFTVDSVAPQLEWDVFTPTGEIASAGWHAQRLEARVKSASDQSRVVVQYDFGLRGNWTQLNGSSVPLPEGLMGVRLRAIDEAGNVEPGKPIQIGWDATKPNLTMHMDSWSRANRTLLQLDGFDRGSPLRIEIAVQAQESTSWNASYSFPWIGEAPEINLANGTNQIHVIAYDAAGNFQDFGARVVGLDQLAPFPTMRNGTLHVQDQGVSGLDKISIEPSTGDAALTFNGEIAVELEGSALERLSGQKIWIFDRAGNYWFGSVDASSSVVTPSATLDAQQLPLATGKPSGEEKGLPGATIPYALAAIALAFARHRRR